jgi:hypothetical protein
MYQFAPCAAFNVPQSAVRNDAEVRCRNAENTHLFDYTMEMPVSPPGSMCFPRGAAIQGPSWQTTHAPPSALVDTETALRISPGAYTSCRERFGARTYAGVQPTALPKTEDTVGSCEVDFKQQRTKIRRTDMPAYNFFDRWQIQTELEKPMATTFTGIDSRREMKDAWRRLHPQEPCPWIKSAGERPPSRISQQAVGIDSGRSFGSLLQESLKCSPCVFSAPQL